jgi:riboflavin kinase
MTSVVKTGIYYGYAQVHPECPEGTASHLPAEDLKVWPMVMSLGWNPYYKNEKLTAVRLILDILSLLFDCI